MAAWVRSGLWRAWFVFCAVLMATAMSAGAATAVAAPTGAAAAVSAASSGPTTAWHNGQFAENVPGTVSRSDIVLGQPNTEASQSMPLGNGTLGAAVWAGNGFTAQLNRADTLPDRLSPGWVVIPGLSKLVSAPDYKGELDLYDGMLTESGGGMTAQIYVPANKDELVVNVQGADPGTAQTAQVQLWPGRNPQVAADGPIATMSSTWVDNTQPAASGQTFGALAAITAGGTDVQAQVVNPLTVRVSFKPHPDGSFRVVVAAPHWTGGDAMTAAASLLGGQATAPASVVSAPHLAWWHAFWHHVGLMELSSADGSAQYLENLRAIDLYTTAAEERGQFPGSQAGVADMFDFTQDNHQWDPAAYWHWNLRMQVGADLGAGATFLNAPYFRLYRDNLANIEAWTTANMGGRPGICVPETMRFNGQGIEYETWLSSVGLNCDAASPPYYNARTLTTGAEVGLWVWQQYLYTGDLSFLRQNYPLMAESARFLLSYATMGSDGYLHTSPSNAHETQWDVTDPTTDIAAMQALFPATIKAAQLLHQNTSLVTQLSTAIPHILPLPRTDAATQTQLLPQSADAQGQDVIAPSYQPAAAKHNSENIGLEPVWPYGLIGDNGQLTALAQRTYADRPNKETNDWSFDPVQAARLGLAQDVASTLTGLTQKYQQYPSGLAHFVSSEPYGEQIGNVTLGLNEALAQDYSGTLQIAPAWPSQWNADGTVYIQGNSKVDVQVEDGTLTTVGIEAGSTQGLRVRNPWPGQQVEVLDYHGNGQPASVSVAPTSAGTFTIPARKGDSYLVQQVADPTTSLPFAEVTGTAPATYKTLGRVSIGLPAPVHYTSLADAYDNVGITADNNTAPGNFDGGGASMSAQAMTAAGAPSGGTFSAGGLTFQIPAYGTGQPDNALATGQYIDDSGSGSTLGFLYVGTYGPLSGTGTIVYSDGTTQSYTLSSTDWQAAPASGETTALTLAYQNRQGNTQYDHPSYVLYTGIPLETGKTVTSVELPDVGPAPVQTTAELHVFAMTIGTPS